MYYFNDHAKNVPAWICHPFTNQTICVCASKSKIPAFIFILCKRFWMEPLSLGWSDIGHIQSALMPTVMPSPVVIIVLKALNEMLGLSSAFFFFFCSDRCYRDRQRIHLCYYICPIYSVATSSLSLICSERVKVSFSFWVKHNIFNKNSLEGKRDHFPIFFKTCITKALNVWFFYVCCGLVLHCHMKWCH